MDITGIIKTAFDTQIVSDKFKKREFVLTTDHTTQYPQQVLFQLVQDKCDLIDQFEDGEEVKVHFNIRGREWNGPQGIKYFNTLDAWKIESANPSQTINKRQQSNISATTKVDNKTEWPSSGQAGGGDNNDLPF